MKAVAAVLAVAGGTWGTLAALPAVRPPDERIAEALALLDRHPPPPFPATGEPADGLTARVARTEAARLALPLLGPEDAAGATSPPDPDFPGAAAYVLGLEVFGRSANRPADWTAAGAHLLRAERDGVPADRRRRLAAAAGLSLARAGRPDLALPRLTAALDKPRGPADPPDRPLLETLVDAALAENRPAPLADAADRVDAAVASTPPADAVWLHRARGAVAVARGDADTARDALARLAPNDAAAPSLAVRLALLAGDPVAAAAALPPAPRFPQPADAGLFHLRARVAEAAGRPAEAVGHYRTAAALAAGPDRLPARLAEARLLTAAGRLEEAAAALAAAAESAAADPPRFRPDLRAELRRAAAACANAGDAGLCGTICDLSEPSLGAAECRRLKAEAFDRVAADPGGAKKAGRAFAAWADVERDAAPRRTARLTAARRLRTGGEAAAALAELDELPAAGDPDPGGLGLLRAELLLDLGDAAAARAAAEELARTRPTDPAAPAARVLAGRAAAEAGDPAAADAAFAAVLGDPDLTPAAAEWRDALFSRARLSAAAALAAVPPSPVPPDEDGNAAAEGDAADIALSAATDALAECLARYPADDRAAAARLTRGRCLLARSQRLDGSPPPPDPLSARRRGERIGEALAAALADFRTVAEDLRTAGAETAPTAAGTARLRLARLWAAECLTRLYRSDAGAVAVAAAVDRDPLSVRSAAALLDLAAARRAAGDDGDAMRAVEQARLTAARLPDDAFAPRASALSRAEWDRLFLLARRSPADDAGPAADPDRNAAP